ncbi:hypothetical protein C8Q80DRAFT_1269641 [Daedaleopsis nitida]|nr:hypothetical protein C8Q80DRAFT_1269641 [Daedaleopsis nitida]
MPGPQRNQRSTVRNAPVLTQTGRSKAGKRACPSCDKEFSLQGFSKHYKKCSKERELARYESERLKQSVAEGSSHQHAHGADTPHTGEQPQSPNYDMANAPSRNTPSPTSLHSVDMADPGAPMGDAPALPVPPADADEHEDPHEDDIRVEYHPHSGKGTRTFRFHEFTREKKAFEGPIDHRPWYPAFQTRVDYEFAELVLAAALKHEQVDKLIKLIRTIENKDDEFTFNSHADVKQSWNNAVNQLTPFTRTIFTIPYKQEHIQHVLYHRNLRDYAFDLVRDPYLVSQMEFDAQRLSKCSNGVFKRFYDEPYTAERFWEVQSKIPAGGKPLGFLVYADKTKLSTFGKEKGYPVIVRCLNLPAHIRNGNGPGGGRILAWLPVVKEVNKDKSEHATYKRVVWHEGLRIVFTSIKDETFVGIWINCGDGEERWLFIFVMILSADFEEQGVMSLTRGSNAKYPCTICLVPKERLPYTWEDHELRTAEKAKEILARARQERKGSKKQEEILQNWGLRLVDNVFFELNNSDPYLALTFDRLHAFHLGLFGHHFWPLLKEFIKAVGSEAADIVDKQFAAFPRWRGLNNFSEVMTIAFNDGNKFRDISLCVLFAVHNIVTEVASPHGYMLLTVVRQYLEVDMYLGLELLIEDTIEEGKKWQIKLGKGIVRFANATKGAPISKESWEFPKGHTYKHAFMDAIMKGVLCHADTRINEALHGPLKISYALRTNFKNVAEQILEVDHYFYVAGHIRDAIIRLDDYVKAAKLKAAERDLDGDATEPEEPLPGQSSIEHFKLRTKQRPKTLQQLQQAHSDDAAYSAPNKPSFHERLSKYLTETLIAHDEPLPNGQNIILGPHDQITEYFMLEVNYESTVDWKTCTDLVRCNPDFHDGERYDGILLQTQAGPVFGRLLNMFTCAVGGKTYPIALVQPFSTSVGTRPRKDKDLGFYRVRERARSRAEFFSVHSIIRGVLLVPDFGKKGDYFVHDLIDGDMFLRMKRLPGFD